MHRLLPLLLTTILAAGCKPDCGSANEVEVAPEPFDDFQPVDGGVMCLKYNNKDLYVRHKLGDGVPALVERYKSETELEIVELEDTLVPGVMDEGERKAQLLLASDDHLYELVFNHRGGDIIQIRLEDRSHQRIPEGMSELRAQAQAQARAMREAAKAPDAPTDCEFGPPGDVLLIDEATLGQLGAPMSGNRLYVMEPVMKALRDTPIIGVDHTAKRQGPSLEDRGSFEGGEASGHVTFFGRERELLCRKPWAARSSTNIEYGTYTNLDAKDQRKHAEGAVRIDFEQAIEEHKRGLFGRGVRGKLIFAEDLRRSRDGDPQPPTPPSR